MEAKEKGESSDSSKLQKENANLQQLVEKQNKKLEKLQKEYSE